MTPSKLALDAHGFRASARRHHVRGLERAEIDDVMNHLALDTAESPHALTFDRQIFEILARQK